MADNNIFNLRLDLHQGPPSGPFSNYVSCARTIEKVLTDGNSTDQIKALFALEQTIGAGATVTVDLLTDLDRYGVALASTSVCMLLVENVDDGTGTGEIEVRPSAGANPWTNFLAATSAVKLRLGSGMVVGCFKANLLAGAANKVFTVVETKVQPTKLRVQLWVRR